MVRPEGSRILERVLITGGCGFIGHNLAKLLAARGSAVTIIDDLSTGSLENIEGIGAEFLRGNILDRTLLESVVRQIQPQLIFHLASLVGVKLTTLRPRDTYTVSETGTANVMAATGRLPVVLFSSSAVYGHDSERVDNSELEKSALEYDGGQPGYAVGKLELERLGFRYATDGRPVIIVRPFNVVGPGQTDQSGAVLPTFVRHALNGSPLTIFDDGGQQRTFASISTFLDAVLTLINAPEAWSSGGVYDLGSDLPVSILEVARTVLRECGSDASIEYLPYGSVFPGRIDVRRRMPRLDAVYSVIGPVDWPPIERIVRELVILARSR